MKSVLKASLVSFATALVIGTGVGYRIGSVDDTLAPGNTPSKPVLTAGAEVSNINTREQEESGIISLKKTGVGSEQNLSTGLSSSDPNTRLTSLFEIWKSELVTKYEPEINQLILSESTSNIKAFAIWMTRDNDFAVENPEIDPYSHMDPDQQIMEVLIENPEQISQGGDALPVDSDLAEPLYSLPESNRLDYIEELVQSNEDASIEALNNLILHEDSIIQSAAIEGLLTILEHDTGHSQQVIEVLDYNSAFLTDLQLAKVQKAILSNQTEESE